MLDFTVDGNSTTVKASGTHCDMLAEAVTLEAQLHRFVYRLGHVEYVTFLMEVAKLSGSDDFMDFLEKDPDEETRITMPNMNPEGDNDAE